MANPFNAQLSESGALKMAASPAMREVLMQTQVADSQNVQGSVTNAVDAGATSVGMRPMSSTIGGVSPWVAGGVALAVGLGVGWLFFR